MPQTAEDIDALIEAVAPEMAELRHEFHRHPEIRFEEHWTADRIAAFLQLADIPFKRGYAKGTGIVAEIAGRSERYVGLRTDIDALEIQEKTGLSYASEIPGRMHACGHDGHMAALCGSALVLKSLQEVLPGSVRLIFQPGEEQAAGARFMVADGAVDGLDGIFALHCWPTLPIGQIGVKSGPAMAGADFFRIVVEGRGCHAADPGAGVDPIVVASHIVTALQSIVSREVNPWDSVVVSVARIEAGHASNVIPETALIEGTFRTLRDTTRMKVREAIQRIAENVAQAHRAHARVELDAEAAYPALHNDPGCCELVKETVRQRFGAERLYEPPYPTMASEDFSFYLQKVPGTFSFLGCNPSLSESYPALHSPRFDFPDAALPYAIKLHVCVALDFLAHG